MITGSLSGTGLVAGAGVLILTGFIAFPGYSSNTMTTKSYMIDVAVSSDGAPVAVSSALIFR